MATTKRIILFLAIGSIALLVAGILAARLNNPIVYDQIGKLCSSISVGDSEASVRKLASDAGAEVIVTGRGLDLVITRLSADTATCRTIIRDGRVLELYESIEGD